MSARGYDARRAAAAARALVGGLVLVLVIALAPLLGASPPAAAAGVADEAGAPRVTAVDSVGIPVTDMERALDFYTHVLDFRVVADREVAGDGYEHLLGVFGLRLRVARLALGEEHIELMQFLAPGGRPLPADLHSNDRAFQHVAIIVRDMDEAYARLRAHHVAHASSGPQLLPAWNPNAGGIAAFYFRDPDGNHLEVLHFPPGKGAARWQSKTALFLGIDHTAIVVGDTDASLAYYRDLLGMHVAGESENWGPEQEQLNGVFGARLRITALRAAQGPGIELLEYLAPRSGRAIPEDSAASDRWYWQVNLLAPALDAIYARAHAAHARFVSNGVQRLGDQALGFDGGFVLRDPDGHADLLRAASAAR